MALVSQRTFDQNHKTFIQKLIEIFERKGGSGHNLALFRQVVRHHMPDRYVIARCEKSASPVYTVIGVLKTICVWNWAEGENEPDWPAFLRQFEGLLDACIVSLGQPKSASAKDEFDFVTDDEEEPELTLVWDNGEFVENPDNNASSTEMLSPHTEADLLERFQQQQEWNDTLETLQQKVAQLEKSLATAQQRLVTHKASSPFE